jgi:hypothetical protein
MRVTPIFERNVSALRNAISSHLPVKITLSFFLTLHDTYPSSDFKILIVVSSILDWGQPSTMFRIALILLLSLVVSFVKQTSSLTLLNKARSEKSFQTSVSRWDRQLRWSGQALHSVISVSGLCGTRPVASVPSNRMPNAQGLLVSPILSMPHI